MAKRKYQFGDVNSPKAKMNDFSGNLPNKEILKFLLSQQGQNVVDQYKRAGYTMNANDYDVQASRPTGQYHLPPSVQAFNAVSQFTTGVANRVNDIHNGRKEYQQYLQALQPISSENFDEQGLNNLPIYAQYGAGCQDGCGQTDDAYINEMMKSGGWIQGAIKHPGRCAHPGDANCPKGSPQYNLAMRFKHGDLHHALYGYKAGGWIQDAIKHPGRCAHPGDSNCPEGSPQYNLAMRFKHGDLHHSQYGSGPQTLDEANQEAKRFAVAKGLISGENTHVDSIPQYIDGSTGKPYAGGQLPYNSSLIKSYVPPQVKDLEWDSQMNLPYFIDPNSGDVQYTKREYFNLPRFKKPQVQPVDNSVAKYPYGGGPLTSEGAKEILRDGTVHGNPLTPAQKKYFGLIAGGGHPKAKTGIDADEASAIVNAGRVKGHPTSSKQKKLFKMIEDGTSLETARAKLKAQYGMPAIEAEKGEAYQTPQGQIMQIPDSAPTHEQGGVVINNAQRVLENTSNLRNDKKSKHLLLTPEVATSLTGVQTDKPVSHAEAMDLAHEELSDNVKGIQNKMKKNLKTLEDVKSDQYATNSMTFNLMNLAGQPNPNDIFNRLFNHQEEVKANYGIENPKVKAQVGIDNAQRLHDTEGWQYLYTKGDKKYYKKSDGTVVASNGPQMSNEDWTNFLQNESPAHKAQRLANQQYTSYGYTPIISPVTDVNYPTSKMPDVQVTPTAPPEFTTDQSTINTTQNKNFNFTGAQPKSRFNEPLNWWDVAGPISGLMEGRIPVKYNPAQLNQIRLQQQNPLPALQAGQRDYNAANQFLPQNAQGYANSANLFQKKYDIDNQTLGQYNNINNQIKNQEIMYNANVKDRQSLLDQNARGSFEDQRLGSLEAERLQHRTDWDSLLQTIAQNHALNRNGNLAMQLFPAFDQNAEYNGYQMKFHAPLNVPVDDSTGLPPNTNIVTNTTNTGKKQYFMKTADGKLKPITFK